MDYGKPDRAQALAADYVAGTLRGPARRRFEALMSGHPALRTAVAEWRGRLIPLTTVLAPVAPPPGTWAVIEQRLWPASAASAATAGAPWWRALGFWRAASGLATTAALALAVVLGLPADVPPPVLVVLQATGKDPSMAGSLVASVSADGRSVVAKPVLPVALQNDRALQLWWAPAVGKPRSLGLIKADGTTVLGRDQLPGGLKGSGIDHLAVSVEPPGGSPTGQPTGAVVFFGKL